MVLKYTLLCIFHLLCTILLLNVFILILPFDATNYLRVANFLTCAIIAKVTFGYSRKLFLGEKLKPKGKAVLITGSARGIGNALAKHLDSKGYHVFASCRDSNSSGADDLRKSCSCRLKVLQLDVTKDESVEKAVKFVKENLGACEFWAIVNNAGIHKGFLTELTSIQDFKDTYETNVLGAIRVTKAFLPLLRKSRGRVVNMASLAERT
ncbi:unnamed protein product [Larinioides sclopetarius]|uniref:Uncharacterized protein n=1 Tax=Larinioides sclopetarius TaxID=280406 RepID=A0AAV2BYQ4_9ARAC